MTRLTIADVQADETFRPSEREFARTKTVYLMFGIKQGTLYNLYHDGEIKGKVLRRRGNVQGVRLWDVSSIREYIRRSQSEFVTNEIELRQAA